LIILVLWVVSWPSAVVTVTIENWTREDLYYISVDLNTKRSSDVETIRRYFTKTIELRRYDNIESLHNAAYLLIIFNEMGSIMRTETIDYPGITEYKHKIKFSFSEVEKSEKIENAETN
jgi:hypothetical protein